MRHLALVLLTLAALAAAESTVLAFGSCNDERKPQPLWPHLLAAGPTAFVWTGDIVYADSDDPAVFARKYAAQLAVADYARLAASVPVYGTWDDHDFGHNNAGREWHGKQVAKDALMAFLGVPDHHPRRQREGVYDDVVVGTGAAAVHVVLLDCRWFRERPGAEADILGAAQWRWLEDRLRAVEVPLTVIVSGIQVVAADHRYEKWAQFPAARARLFALLAATRTHGAIFVSGDRHLAEVSREDQAPTGYPLWDLTSSGLTHSWADHPGEPNRRRVGDIYAGRNAGLVILEAGDEPAVTLAILGADGQRHGSWRILLESLRP